jgi:two-component system chemotaxis sensor kinase CheA
MIDCAFRALHTIKGSGGMFGFHEIVAFTHDIESVYDQVRNGKLEISGNLIDLTFTAHDCLIRMLDIQSADSETERTRRREITESFKQLLGNETATPVKVEKANLKTPEVSQTPVAEKAVKRIVRIRFKPDEAVFAGGTNPILLFKELCSLGECHVIARMNRLPSLEMLDPEKCYTWWDIILITTQPKSVIQEVFMFVEDNSDLYINVIGSDQELDEDLPFKRLGQILVNRGDLKADELNEILAKKEKLGKKLSDSGLVLPDQVQSALMVQNQLKLNAIWKRSEAIANIRLISREMNRLGKIINELEEQHRQSNLYACEIRNLPSLALNEKAERITAEAKAKITQVTGKIHYQKFLTY